MALLDVAEANDVTVLLDEAFIDYAPQSSLVHVAATTSGLIVLRSLDQVLRHPRIACRLRGLLVRYGGGDQAAI